MVVSRWLLFGTLECILLYISGQSVVQGRRCVFLAKPQNIRYKTLLGNVTGSEQLCARTNCCSGYFLLINGQPVADFLACDVAEKICPDTTCEASTNFINSIKCVCNADLCNGNITWNPKPQQPQLTFSYALDEAYTAVVVIPIGIVLVLSGTILVLVVKWRQNLREHKKKPQSLCEVTVNPLCSCCTSETSVIDCDRIELQKIVGRGHFATVWRGSYQQSEVAVKVFPAGCKHEFTWEKEVHELPLMEHAGIVHFLGTGSKVESKEWLIVLDLAAYGSLHSFLCKHTSDWMSSLKLSLSLSQGLAYLHSDLHSCGVHKPAVAHRDLSSSNVLVQADGTCALSDFGCSTILRKCPGHHSWQNHQGTMKGRALVGTLRYMSPEILEGSVDLSSGWGLMQGDVYALALLLWEIWVRCFDLFDGCPVPEHHLPYEAELGASLTLERLILHVSNMNKRPSIPKHWEQIPQVSIVEEIMTDCWDCDADARLTALCVADRLLSLHSSHSHNLEEETLDTEFLIKSLRSKTSFQGLPPSGHSPYPAYAPGHYPAYPSAPPPGFFPQAPNPPGQYPGYPVGVNHAMKPTMNPAMNPAMHPAMLPGTMPYGAPGQYPYPVAPVGYPGVHQAGVHPGQYPRSPMWGHHKGHHKVFHGGHHGHLTPKPGPGVLAVGLTAIGMGIVGKKAHKKMRKKMKKAHKVHKDWHHGYGKSSSSSSSSD